MHACAACARSGATTARACRGGVSGPERHGDHEDDRHDSGECRHHGRRRPGGVRAGRPDGRFAVHRPAVAARSRRPADGHRPAEEREGGRDRPLPHRRHHPGGTDRRGRSDVHHRGAHRAPRSGYDDVGRARRVSHRRRRPGTRLGPFRTSARVHLPRQALEGDAEAAGSTCRCRGCSCAGADGRGRGCALDPGCRHRRPGQGCAVRRLPRRAVFQAGAYRQRGAHRPAGRGRRSANGARGADGRDGVDHHPHLAERRSGPRSSSR